MRRDAGFTLLEILIAIAITALLVTAAFEVFQGVRASQDVARAGRGRGLAAQILLDRLERELVGTTLVVKVEGADRLMHPWLFVSEDRVFRTHDSSSLRFVTQTPARGARSSGRGALRMVSYELRSAQEDRLDLYRHEEPLPRQMQKQVDPDAGVPVAEDIYRFDLRFRDEEDGSWHDAWDSTDIALLDRMPGAVEITLQVMVADPEGGVVAGPEHTRLVELPVRPLLRARGRQDAFDRRCPDGVSVEVCLARISGATRPMATTAADILRRARLKVTDLCWNSETASVALIELRQVVRRFTTAYPEVVCR